MKFLTSNLQLKRHELWHLKSAKLVPEAGLPIDQHGNDTVAGPPVSALLCQGPSRTRRVWPRGRHLDPSWSDADHHHKGHRQTSQRRPAARLTAALRRHKSSLATRSVSGERLTHKMSDGLAARVIRTTCLLRKRVVRLLIFKHWVRFMSHSKKLSHCSITSPCGDGTSWQIVAMALPRRAQAGEPKRLPKAVLEGLKGISQ